MIQAFKGNFYGISIVDEIFKRHNEIATLKRLAWIKPRDFIEIFARDNIRRDLILNWFEPNDYL